MTDQNQREWPSFGDILSELNSLGQLSATYGAGSPDENAEGADATSLNAGDAADTDEAVVQLPAELPVAEIDTTPLDDPFTETSSAGDLDFSALEPITPAADLVEETSMRAETETELAAPTTLPAETESDLIAEAPIESDPDSDMQEGSAPTIAESEPSIAASESTLGTFDPFTGEIDWSSTDWAADTDEPLAAAEDPDAWSSPGFDDIAESDQEHAAGTVFPLQSTVDEAVEEELPESPMFDSVATANAIEEDLQDLFSLDQVPEGQDNVVQLHASSDDQADAVVGLDTVFDQDAEEHEPLQEWVGVDPEELRPKDPWAHMRPPEEEAKTGFWASRPKFFGGDERKAKKAARRATQADVEAALPGAEEQLDGPPCPACHEPGRVDLEDPIGMRQHLSCPQCGQVWSLSLPADQKSA